jgi:hypothetical protein
MKFYIREDLLNLLGQDFYQYYRINRNDRYEKLNSPARVNYAVGQMFAEIHNMLDECKHGIVLKNFGVIAPKEFLEEDKQNIFRVKYKKRGSYKVFLENEYLNSQYKATLTHRSYKKEGQVTEIKKPRPHAVLLHRKKLRKNKLKDSDGED